VQAVQVSQGGESLLVLTPEEEKADAPGGKHRARLARLDTETLKPTGELDQGPGGGDEAHTRLAPDGHTALWSSGVGLALRDLVTGKELIPESALPRFAKHGVFCADSSRVAVTWKEHDDNFIGVWDVRTGNKVITFPRPGDLIWTVDFSPDCRTLALSMGEGLFLHDAQTGAQVARLEEFSLRSMFTPDGKFLISSPLRSTALRVWDVAARKQVGALAGQTDTLRSLAVSPDGKQVAASDYTGTVLLWDLASRTLLARLVSTATGAAGYFLPDGLFTASRDLATQAHFVRGLETFDFGVFDLVLNRPDRVVERLGRAAPGTVERLAAARRKRLARMGFADDKLTVDLRLPRCTVTQRPQPKGPAQAARVLVVKPGSVAEKAGLRADDLILSVNLKSYPKTEEWLAALKEKGSYFLELERDGKPLQVELKKEDEPLGFAPEAELNDEVVTTFPQATFDVACEDKEHALRALNVAVDGVPTTNGGLPLAPGEAHAFKRTVQVDLLTGPNSVEISALDDAGLESPRTPLEVVYGRRQFATTWVLAIGASHYQDSRSDLTYAAKDAADLAALVGKRTRVKVLTLTDAEVTREKVLAARAFLEGAAPQDVVVVFYAGHGLLDDKLDYWLATHDVDFEKPSGRGLAYGALAGLLDGLKSRRKLLLIDACHSGEVDKDEVKLAKAEAQPEANVKSRGLSRVVGKESGPGLEGSFELMQEVFADLRRTNGAAVIASASGKQFALESPEWNNGVFTYALLRGLSGAAVDKNQDGVISVAELKEYVTAEVTRLTAGQQTPTARSENVGFDFPVAPAPKASPAR
jgi:hypothetical protein